MKLTDYWLNIADITITDAALILCGIDPWTHEYRRQCDPKIDEYFEDRYVFEDVADQAVILTNNIRAGILPLRNETYLSNGELDLRRTTILMPDFVSWCRSHGHGESFSAFPCQHPQNANEPVTPIVQQTIPAQVAKQILERTENTDARYPWLPAARAIARELATQNARLNLDKLGDKVHAEMKKQHDLGQPGMTGRGGRVPSGGTIKRHALTGIRK